MIGYVSLAVGYIVGKAIKKGSKGAGGRRYQIAAVALTYAAVSLAAIPIYISIYAKQQKAKRSETQQQELQPSQAPQSPATDSNQTTTSAAVHRRSAGLASALIKLALIGLASPFLELADPVHGLIGLVILFVGIRIAWQIAAGSEIQILGPFENSAPAPA